MKLCPPKIQFSIKYYLHEGLVLLEAQWIDSISSENFTFFFLSGLIVYWKISPQIKRNGEPFLGGRRNFIIILLLLRRPLRNQLETFARPAPTFKRHSGFHCDEYPGGLPQFLSLSKLCIIEKSNQCSFKPSNILLIEFKEGNPHC